MRALVALVLVCAGLVGCGGAPPPAPVRAASPPPQAPEIVLAEEGVIHRAALEEVIDAGLGLFLQKVTTEPDLREGRFVGFRVTELHDEGLFAGVDLQPGDTVVEVNGQSIERPELAYTVWTGLRVASELTIVVLRGEERRELRFEILD